MPLAGELHERIGRGERLDIAAREPGYPEMQVAGNGSSAYDLNWYQDRSDPALPQAEAWSVPLSAYRQSGAKLM